VAIDWSTFGVDLHVDVGQGDVGQGDVGHAGGRRVGLERALREAIRGGRLAPQTRLPSTRALAVALNLSRGTVCAAYDQLVAEGYLSAAVGSGTTVAALARPLARPRRPAGPPAAPRYDMRPGSPDVSSFPTAAWLRAGRRALTAAPASTFGYGDPTGHPALRAALAEYLGRARGVLTTPEQIVVTSGYVQALSLLTAVVGGPVAMEDPGLAFHREVVGRTGASVVPLAVDGRGACTDRLSTMDGVRAVVLTPAHQYPTGVTLHPQRRQAATGWARSVGGLVIEDDYDGEFRYDRQPVGALQGTAPDHVAYLGTSSKTLGPALRLAWLVLPERLVAPVVRAKFLADVHTETLGQLTLADLVTSHAYDRHVRAGRARYRRRRDLLVERLVPLRRHGVTVGGIAAGLHVMIGLPPGGPTEEEVLDRAAARGLAMAGLAEHWHAPGDHPKGLVVGYAAPGEGGYPAALDTLARTLRNLSGPTTA
jgi:GntR family transcriptional regulator/MocR family aminotransferase